MTRLNITAKIWLSIGVFVLGFVVSTVLEQVQGLSTEGTLRTTAQALFPAAQRSLDSALANYTSGKLDFLRLLDAERQLNTQRDMYYQSIAEYHRSLAELERAVGEPVSTSP